MIVKVTLAIAVLASLGTLIWLVLHGTPLGTVLDLGPLTVLAAVVILGGGALAELESLTDDDEDRR